MRALAEQDLLHDVGDKVECVSVEGMPEAHRVEHEQCLPLHCVFVVFWYFKHCNRPLPANQPDARAMEAIGEALDQGDSNRSPAHASGPLYSFPIFVYTSMRVCSAGAPNAAHVAAAGFAIAKSRIKPFISTAPRIAGLLCSLTVSAPTMPLLNPCLQQELRPVVRVSPQLAAGMRIMSLSPGLAPQRHLLCTAVPMSQGM